MCTGNEKINLDFNNRNDFSVGISPDTGANSYNNMFQEEYDVIRWVPDMLVLRPRQLLLILG
jgi:hypothetical protein